MSVVSNPLIGKTRQSMGNATFSTWKGINVLKTKATSVANPRSQPQIQQRDAFTQIVEAFRAMPAAIRAGYKKLAVKKSEFNAFMSATLNEAFNMATPGIALFVPALAKVSKGTIAQSALTASVADVSLATITITFPTTATQPGQATSDLAIIGCYNSTLKQWAGGATAALRSSGTASIPLPVSWAAANVIQSYLGFYNLISGESSDSVNVSGVVVA